MTNGSGTLLGLDRIAEFGRPQAANIGAFGYTGQAWLPSVGAWYYKARVHDPELGRFLQPDPIGYDDGLNLYAYVGNDPVNFVDPLGLQQECGVPGTPDCSPILVVGSFGAAGSLGGGLGGGGGGGGVQVPGHSSHPPGVEGVSFEDKPPQNEDSNKPSASDCLIFAGKKNGVNLIGWRGALGVRCSAFPRTII